MRSAVAVIAVLATLSLLSAPLDLGTSSVEAEVGPSFGQRLAFTGLAIVGGLAVSHVDEGIARELDAPLPLLIAPQVGFLNAWLAPAFDLDVGPGTLLRAGLSAGVAALLAYLIGLPMASDGVGASIGRSLGIVAFSTVFPLAVATDAGWSAFCGGPARDRPPAVE